MSKAAKNNKRVARRNLEELIFSIIAGSGFYIVAIVISVELLEWPQKLMWISAIPALLVALTCTRRHFGYDWETDYASWPGMALMVAAMLLVVLSPILGFYLVGRIMQFSM